MKNILLSILLGFVLTVPHQATAAQIKIKYVGSIYTDAAGVPLRHPGGVAIAGETLLVADSDSRRIVSYRFAQGVATPVKSFPLPKMFPIMVEQAANGDIYVLDGRERQIVVLGPDGNVKGELSPKGIPHDGRIIPRSFRITADGAIMILDIFSGRALLLEANGQYRRQIPFPAESGAFADLAMDAQGTIYLLDSVMGSVYKAPAGSNAFTLLTNSLKEYTNFPTSLAVGRDGNLYIIDKHGSGLAIIGVDGAFAGRKISMGWNDGQLYYPSHISMNTDGNIFIADTQNNRIQQFDIVE